MADAKLLISHNQSRSVSLTAYFSMFCVSCLLLCLSSFTYFVSVSYSSFIIQADGEYITDADAIPELPFAAWEPHAWARANYASRMQWLLTLARFGALTC